MSDNLDLWDSVSVTDMSHTKQVTVPYRHTDINSTYMFRCATEAFGPLGVGWGYTLGEPVWLASKTDGLGLVVIRVELWHNWGGKRSEPITVYGCKPVEYDTSTGKHMLDDEAVKKATTDGIKKALSMLGVSADVFLGERDDGGPSSTRRPASKPAAAPQGKPTPAAKPAPAATGGDVTRDAMLGFGQHKDETWRKVEASYLVWMRDNIDPTKDTHAALRHGSAVAELAARAFPDGFGPDIPLPAGYEHAGERLCDVPNPYLERMELKGVGKCVKVAIAELARRTQMGISIPEPANDDGADLPDEDIPFGEPERKVEAVCQHCGSDDMTDEACSKGFMQCKACKKYTAVTRAAGPDDGFPF